MYFQGYNLKEIKDETGIDYSTLHRKFYSVENLPKTPTNYRNRIKVSVEIQKVSCIFI